MSEETSTDSRDEPWPPTEGTGPRCEEGQRHRQWEVGTFTSTANAPRDNVPCLLCRHRHLFRDIPEDGERNPGVFQGGLSISFHCFLSSFSEPHAAQSVVSCHSRVPPLSVGAATTGRTKSHVCYVFSYTYGPLLNLICRSGTITG